MNIALPILTKEETVKTFLTFSKGKCSKKLTVYDLWIYHNGDVVYNGIKNVPKLGVHTARVSNDVILKLDFYLTNANAKEINYVLGNDKPLNILKYQEKKVVFQSNRVKGNLRETYNILENIVNKINNLE
ncbi:DUF6438 domain-containing protein [Gaetbulibacter saemankumensis]|uniref:DUF6438 domain-containing protein n=1 Tax=Gaetbulibacter saemankumensis TaxID=311208 RepID=UPI000419DDD2|nr:DUF6438 domain-containing protein [Gaetbulibacter saemankumensis]